MWEKFLRSSHTDADKYEAWAFGGAPDELADLVLAGQKTACKKQDCLFVKTCRFCVKNLKFAFR